MLGGGVKFPSGIAPDPLPDCVSHAQPWFSRMLVYEDWIRAESVRRLEYVASPEPGLMSIISPVRDTPREFLGPLAESIFGQDFGLGDSFEWLILDNGSTRA